MQSLTALSLIPLASIMVILPIMLADAFNQANRKRGMGHADNLMTVPLGRERFYSQRPVRNEYHTSL